ncbi:MAG: hypothetical protein DRQ61_03430 [Gammaproteobacteria bacterium]|nr:MAG: hypothetical protein DRQ56_03980 [Gammaproteobacteria bacterium]RLA23589.1 MAG: hypothetical protein DRQ61_03430 [Gammaproteobacteria bacterium]
MIMLTRIFKSEHLERLQKGFFEAPNWLEKAIPRHSIKQLVSTSILAVLGYFLLIMSVSSIEGVLISRYQKTISEQVFPLLLVSRDLQENLSELVIFEDRLVSARSRHALGMTTSISTVTLSTEDNLLKLRNLIGDSANLTAPLEHLASSFRDIEKALYDLSLLKGTLLTTQMRFHGFQEKIRQLFSMMVLLDDELSGKISLMSIRLQRHLKIEGVDDIKAVERQKKIDTGSARMGLSIARLGKLLIKFNALKSREELLNFRDNQLKQELVLLQRQVNGLSLLLKSPWHEGRLNEISEELSLHLHKLHNFLLIEDESLFNFTQQRLEQTKKIRVTAEAFRGFTFEMNKALKSIAITSELKAKEAIAKVQFIATAGGWMVFLLGIILAIVLILFLATIFRRINKPISTLSSAMHSLSSGDVSTRLSSGTALSREFSSLWKDFNRFAERTERLLKEQEIIFDNAEIGISWIRDRRYVKVNAKMLEIFNARKGYFVGKGTRVIYCHEKDYLRIGEGYLSLEKGNIYSTEVEVKRADGSTFWCKISGKSTGLGSGNEAVWLHEDITKRRLADEKLYKLANYDDLTELPNRSFFSLMLDQAIQRGKRNKTEFAVLFIDLDRFKHINDSLGHDVGDQVLCEIGRRIQNVIRASDVAARLGGDEFTVIVDSFGTTTDLLNVAEKINLELSRSIIFEQRELFVGGSIGISIYPKDGLVPGDLLSHADAAMYAAKEMGRNNAQFYNRQISQLSEKFMELSSSLRVALENNEFELHFQPKVELKTRKIIGMEALIRWNRPGFGLISPFEFIPILEEAGLMSEVGSWVIQEAGRAYQKWVKKGLNPGHIAVNLSERQFNNGQLLDSLSAVLTETGIPASALELEITESLMMGDAHNATNVLKEIKSRGFSIAMDDFGTGYSSLAYLKRFPIDTIKIDRTFVRDITTDEDDAAIIDAILAIARQLKLKSVAEGIEEEEQLAYLLEKGCEIGQGYLFSKPVPVDEMANLLAKGL